MSSGRGPVRFYLVLLALYPKSHRLEYGPDMVQLFSDRYRDEQPNGDVFRFARFWGGMVGDLFRTALAERTESVVSSFKQNWWKWAIGTFAAFQAVFAAEAIFALVVAWEEPAVGISDAVIPVIGAALLLGGLKQMTVRPRLAAWLLTIGLLPVVLAGAVFWWFPPMWAVSVLGVYLIAKVFMEAGRVTRPATV